MQAVVSQPFRPSQSSPSASLFERTAPLYAYFREHLFRDNTDRISGALWPEGNPPPGSTLLEVGCGPGRYARRLAARFPGLRTVGIDRSWRLLEIAAARAAADALPNCRFEQGDALALDWPDASVDAVVASRLFMVVDGARALAEMHRVLRPGGRCYVSEPIGGVIGGVSAVAPLLALRLAGWLASPWPMPAFACPAPSATEMAPRWPTMFAPDQFDALVHRQPWVSVQVSSANGYHEAVCEKGV